MTKTVLITGATSGIGEAAARTFAAAGWRVIATGRRAERLDALAASLGSDKLHPAAFDVCDERRATRRYRRCRTDFATSTCSSTTRGWRSAPNLPSRRISPNGRR